MATKTRQILLHERPNGLPDKNTFAFKHIEIDSPAEGEVLLQMIYISVDPYMRGRMDDRESYVPPFPLHKPIAGGAIAKVLESRDDSLKEGDYVTGNLPWQQYVNVSASDVRKVQAEAAPVSAYLSAVGMPGLTAYFGTLSIGQPKQGETFVISGGAGAVGSLAGQIAKMQGARVVGIAGTDEKLDYMKSIGFDEVINYKTEDLTKAIKRTCPDKVDVYFDNVGGEMSDIVLDHLNKFARVVQCGAISTYNDPDNYGPRVQFKLIKSSALMKGFIIGDYADEFEEATKQLAAWVASGDLQYEETILTGFDRIPEAFIGLFTGRNTGKLLVDVSE
ncbi:hypothetical protein SAMN05421781_2651 [Marinococcus luteus]|uniref:Enoyl reductase (ER) domain-containing protein n=1 Tax=Marinococcus luteus TaxID=1122204 RepID=A0A1H2X4X1_9BACI|nr:NADP-dependent oxidoreductase [Marinococcus luteus]SDW87930.1 hypothetical protein SAMN05421781_2651 [Marinococcus luteus]